MNIYTIRQIAMHCIVSYYTIVSCLVVNTGFICAPARVCVCAVNARELSSWHRKYIGGNEIYQ